MNGKQQKWILMIVFALASAFFIYRTRSKWMDIASILSLSAFLTIILAPLSSRVERTGINTHWAALISILFFLCVLFVFLMVFVPYLLSHTFLLMKRITPTVVALADQGYALLLQLGYRGEEFGLNLPQLFASSAASLTAGIAKGGAAFITAAGGLIMALVIAYYLLTVRREAGFHLLLCIPTPYRSVTLRILNGCRNAVLGYLSGLIKTCAFVAAASFIGLFLLGVKEAPILSLFMGLLEIIPYIGPFLGTIPILLAVLPMGILKTLLAILLVFLIQQIESGVIGPYFTASSTSIHPLTAILVVFIAGSLFGLIGIVFAVPVTVMSRSVLYSMRSVSIHPDS